MHHARELLLSLLTDEERGSKKLIFQGYPLLYGRIKKKTELYLPNFMLCDCSVLQPHRTHYI